MSGGTNNLSRGNGRGPERRNGRFATPRSRIVLCKIVRQGLEEASRRSPQRKPANAISQREFRIVRARLESEWGSVPLPHEICRQLANWAGEPVPWEELRDAVLDENLDLKAWDEARLSEPEREVDDELIFLALNRVAREIGATTLFPHQYDQWREALIDHAKRTRTGADQMALLLPSRGQIETACGSWDQALVIAKLGPRPHQEHPGGLPIQDAIALFYASEGYLPTQLELEHFGRFRGFAREGRKKRSWPQCLELGLVRIRDLALPAPPEYGTRPEEGTWKPIELDLGELPTALSSEPYPHVAVVERVREFALGLRGRSATDWRWRSFARGRPDVPSLKVIKAHGGLDALLEEAARPGWRERAEVWVDPRHKTPDQEAAEAAARLQRRAHKPDAQAVYEVIRAGDGVSAGEIADALSWKLDRVRSWLRVLKGAERIVPTNTFAQAKNQTYRIVDEQQSAIEREAA